MMMMMMTTTTTTTMTRLTEFVAAAVLEDAPVGRVETYASHHVSQLGTVHHAVAAVPEVEQVEYVSYV